MSNKVKETLFERIAFAYFGGITGAIYGLILTALVFVITHTFHSKIILFSGLVFSFLGFFFGNFIFEAFVALTHLIWGFFNGVTDNISADASDQSKGYLRYFFLIGVGTGFVFIGWRLF